MIIYVDMDGCLSNFEDKFVAFLDGRKRTHELFREASEDQRIFRHLDMMPHANRLISRLWELGSIGYSIQILSNACTVTQQQKSVVMEDKNWWLNEHSIIWPRVYVNQKHEKALYATPNTVLIDDDMMNIGHFNSNHGHGIIHVDPVWYMTVSELNQWVSKNPIRTFYTL